jgi:hypothetical protein
MRPIYFLCRANAVLSRQKTKTPVIGQGEMKMTTHAPVDTTLYLDARYDLAQSGDDVTTADDYRESYEQCAHEIARLLGVTITVATPPMSNYGGLPGGEVESTEWARAADLWQAIHGMIFWDDEPSQWMYHAQAAHALAAKLAAK